MRSSSMLVRSSVYSKHSCLNCENEDIVCFSSARSAHLSFFGPIYSNLCSSQLRLISSRTF